MNLIEKGDGRSDRRLFCSTFHYKFIFEESSSE